MNRETNKNQNLSPDNSLPSYDGAKLPPLQPRDQNSDAKSTINPEDNWMPSPFVSNGLPGLEYLSNIDKFVVNQNLDRDERKIKYLIKNDLAQNVYTAVEEYNKCCLTCCSSNRPFDIRILNYQEREVLRFQRPFRSKSCCFPCCLQSVTVTASGTLCGFVKQSWHPSKPKLKICDASGNTVLLIEGPGRFLDSLCLGTNYAGPKFKVFLHDGKTEVGHVSKLLASVIRESFPNAKHFSISFPVDLDVNIKAVLLAASILIDSMYYNTSFRTTESSAAFSTGFECGYCLSLCLLH